MIYNGFNSSKYALNLKFPATKPVSHLPCPPATKPIFPTTFTALPHHRMTFFPPHLLHHCVTTLVSHLTCPLPPHHIYYVTTLVSHLTCPLPPHHIYCITALPHPHISQSFDLSPATPPHLLYHHVKTLVSHLTCPLPPHHIYCVTALPC